MMIAFTDSFLKYEYAPLRRVFSLIDIKKFCLKSHTASTAVSNLGLSGVRFVKIRIMKKPAARMLLMIQLDQNLYVPLLFRLKKDKLMGQNFSLSNSQFKKVLLERIRQIFDDLDRKQFYCEDVKM